MGDNARKGLGCLPAVGICLIVLAIALYAVWPSDEEMAKEQAASLASAPEVALTADEFVNGFAVDDEASLAKFDGKVAVISGQVKGARESNGDEAVLSFATISGAPLDVSVNAADKARVFALKAGDDATVRCARILAVLGARVPSQCQLK